MMAEGAGGASFVRGLNVLIAVGEYGELRAEEIAAEVEVPVSTVYRYLRTLRDMELVEERDGSYVPGWRLLELSGQDLAHTRLVEVGHSFLREISEATGETAVLTVRAGTHAVCLRQVESRRPLRLAFKIGQLLPLYAGAGQRVLLAYAPSTVVEQVLRNPLRSITERTLDRQVVERQLEEIRRNSYLISHGELYDGAVAVAIPVFASGEIICSLTVAGPDFRCKTAAWQRNARTTLVEAGHRLAEVIDDQRGGRQAPGPTR